VALKLFPTLLQRARLPPSVVRHSPFEIIFPEKEEAVNGGTDGSELTSVAIPCNALQLSRRNSWRAAAEATEAGGGKRIKEVGNKADGPKALCKDFAAFVLGAPEGMNGTRPAL